MRKINSLFLFCFLALSWQLNAQTLFEGFEGTNFPPTGWDTISNGNGIVENWATSSTSATGSAAAAITYENVSSGVAEDWLITPLTAITAADSLIFSHRQSFGTVYNSFYTIRVGTTTQRDTANFTTIKSYTESDFGPTTYENDTIDLSAYAGQSIYIAFVMSNDDGDSWIVDDIQIGFPSCFDPTSPVNSNTTANSIDLAWTENGTATEWEVEYDTAGFTLGTGRNVVQVLTNPITSLSSLTGNTAYDWYIRAVCGPGDSSTWIASSFFTGYCPIISTASGSYFDDFTTSNGAMNISNTTSGYATNGYQDATAMTVSQFATASIDFNATLVGTTVGVNIWVDWNNDLVFDASEKEFASGGYVSSASGSITVPSGTALGNYRMRIRCDFNSTDPNACGASGSGRNETEDYTFTVIAPPSCLAPSSNTASALTATTAVVSWIENGMATEWEVEYDTSGFTLGTGRNVVQVLTDTFTTITGLTSSTDYDWYVRAVCAPMDSSTWTSISTFTTTANSVTAPYAQDFEGANPLDNFTLMMGSDALLSLDAGSNCTATNSLFMTGGSSVGWAGSSGATATTPTQAWVTNTTKQSSATLNVDATGIISGGLELSFDLKQEWSYGAGYSWARILVNGTQISPDYQPATQNADPCTNYLLDLAPYVGTNFSITFQFAGKYDDARGNAGQGDNAFFDNIQLVPITCPDPTNLTASAITATSADLSWTENGSATSWNVEYGVQGFIPGTGTTVVSTNDTLGVSSLSIFTSYDFYVQADCGADSSRLVGPFTFTVGTPLAGTYTIDSTQATGITNFESFSSFATAINTFGVSAAVDVNVAANTYNDQLSLGEIAGASMTNTVSINGNGVATLTHDKSIRNSTITVEGTSWLTIQKMTIAATGGADSWGIHLLDSAHHITIDSNVIQLPVGTATDVAGIISSNTEDSDVGSGSNAYDVTISNNSITGGENGMSMRGDFTATNRNANITITNNVMTDNDDRGIYIAGWDNVVITGNIVNTPNNSGSDAFYSSDLENFDISGNYFSGNDFGMDMDDSNFDNDVSTYSTISNNMVIGGDDALSLDDVDSVNVFHNTLYAEDWALILNDDSNLDIRNNILYSVDDHAFNSDDGVVHTMDNNIFYTGGTADLVEFGTSVYTDLAAFQAGEVTMNANSLEGDPVFVNNGIDLHLNGPLANDVGDNSVGITTDIDGDARPIAPSTIVDIGADEFNPPACPAPSTNVASSITSDSVLVSWLEIGTATSWEVEWDTAGYTAGMGRNSMLVTVDTFFTINGLTANTSYDYYVRAICGPMDTSVWSTASTFTTSCSAFTAPYAENFDLGTAGNFNSAGVACWQAVGAGADDADISTTTDQGTAIPSSPNAIELNDGTWPNDPSIVVSPPFSDLASGLNRITMDLAFESTTPADVNLYIGIISDPSDINTFVILDTVDATDIGGTTSFGSYALNLDNPALIGSAQYIAIAHGVGVFEAYVDNFVYEQIPPCLAPTANMATEIGQDSANVSWIAASVGSSSAISFIVEWDTAGFTTGNGRNTMMVNDTFMTISSLMSSINYEYNVRSICAPGDTSLVSNTIAFTTLAIPSPYYPVGTINTIDAAGLPDSNGVAVSTSGIVMGVDLDGNAGYLFTIIDMSSGAQEGIGVFNAADVDGYTVNQGDSILIDGTVGSFRGLTQLTNINSISVIAAGVTTPAPIEVDFPSEGTESKWIKINNVHSLEVSGAAGSNNNHDFTRGSDTLTMRVDLDTDVDDSLAVYPIAIGDSLCSITGIGGQFSFAANLDDGYQIVMHNYADMDTTSCSFIVGIEDKTETKDAFSVYPNPTKGQFIIETNGFKNPTVQITIRDLSGRIVNDRIISNANQAFQHSIDLSENAKGIYFITVQDGNNRTNQKLILQ